MGQLLTSVPKYRAALAMGSLLAMAFLGAGIYAAAVQSTNWAVALLCGALCHGVYVGTVGWKYNESRHNT